MRRRGVLVGVWAIATLGATLVAWAAVRQVTAEVSPSQALPFPSTVAVAGTPPDVATPTQAPATEDPQVAGGRSDQPAGEPPPGDAQQPPRPRAPAEQNGVPAPPPDDAQDEQAEGTAVTEAYSLTGGVVTVRYRDASATLVSATPNSGFGVEVNDGGPGKVDVRFRSDRHESRLVTRMRDGSPDPEIEERPR